MIIVINYYIIKSKFQYLDPDDPGEVSAIDKSNISMRDYDSKIVSMAASQSSSAIVNRSKESVYYLPNANLDQVGKVVDCMRKYGFCTYDPVKTKINWFLSEFETMIASLNVNVNELGKEILLEFLDSNGQEIYFQAISYKPSIRYSDIKELLIDYFTTFKIDQIKKAIDMKYGSGSLLDYIEKKYDALKYVFPVIVDMHEDDIISMIIVSFNNDEIIKKFSNLSVSNLKHLKTLANVYDKQKAKPNQPPTYNVSHFFKNRDANSEKVCIQDDQPQTVNQAMNNSRLQLSAGLLDRLNKNPASPSAPRLENQNDEQNLQA